MKIKFFHLESNKELKASEEEKMSRHATNTKIRQPFLPKELTRCGKTQWGLLLSMPIELY